MKCLRLAAVPASPPVAFLQSRQWQTAIKVGSVLNSNLIARKRTELAKNVQLSAKRLSKRLLLVGVDTDAGLKKVLDPQRQLATLSAGGVVHGIRDGGGRASETDFAHSARTEGVLFELRMLNEVDIDDAIEIEEKVDI
jgi:hypothetical protein